MAVNERAFVAQPVPLAGGRIVAAPFQFYTTGEDRLRVVSVNSLAGVTLAIHSRMVDSKGLIQANAERHVPNSNRTTAATEHELGVGALLNLTVFASQGAPVVGQTFVIVQLIRGAGAAAIVLGTLLQGYVTSTQQLSWPGSPIVSSTEGEPFVRVIVGTDPAVDTECLETVPTGARWELLAFVVDIVTSGLGGGRQPTLVFRAGANIYGQFPSVSPIPAGTGKKICWAAGLPTPTTINAFRPLAGLPTPSILLAGHTIETLSDGGAAGDDYGAPVYCVREWLEGP